MKKKSEAKFSYVDKEGIISSCLYDYIICKGTKLNKAIDLKCFPPCWKEFFHYKDATVEYMKNINSGHNYLRVYASDKRKAKSILEEIIKKSDMKKHAETIEILKELFKVYSKFL